MCSLVGGVKSRGVRKHSVRCVAWPRSKLMSVPALAALSLKPGGCVSPACEGGFAQEGCWRAGGSRVTSSHRAVTLKHGSRCRVPGPGCLPPCSPEPGSGTDLPPVIPKGRKHLWRHHGKGDVGTPVTRGWGGLWVREGRGICCCYR